MNTLGLITLVAGSSVLAAMVTKGVDIWIDRGRRRVDADFAALYVAVALEAYADDCATLVGESETFESSSGAAGAHRCNIANLPPYPDNIDWKAFGIRPATASLTFRVEVEGVRGMISDLWEFNDDDAIRLVREHSTRLGLKALSLASDFRRSRGLGPVSTNGDWSVKRYLAERHEAYEDQRKHIEARRSASTAALGL